MVAANARRHEHVDFLEPAQALVADEFAGEVKIAAAALLRAGLENDLVVAHGLDDVAALVHGERERFLAIDILPGFGGGDIDERVPVIGRGLNDGVNVLALQQLAEVGEFRGRLAFAGELADGGRGVALIHVAHGHDIREPPGVAGVAPAHAATADQRHAGAIVRAGHGVGGFRRRQLTLQKPDRQTAGGRRESGASKKRTARNMERGIHVRKMNNTAGRGKQGGVKV